MSNWRPEDWIRERNIFFETHQPLSPYYKTRQIDYEAGASALLEAVVKFIGGVLTEGKWKVVKGESEDKDL